MARPLFLTLKVLTSLSLLRISLLFRDAATGKVWGVNRRSAYFGDESMLEREGFLQVKKAAELLSVSPNTVRTWGADGKIPEYRHPVNNYRLYKREDLKRVLQELEESVSNPPKRAVLRRTK